jgi:hypothetical protein
MLNLLIIVLSSKRSLHVRAVSLPQCPDVSMPPDCVEHSRSASANVFSLISSSGKHAYFGAEPVATFLSQRVVEGSLKDHSGRLSR